MSAKHTPAVLAGIRNDAAVSASGRLFPWPAEIHGLGRRSLTPIDVCADCPPGIHVSASSTFVAFGGRPICLPCARRRLKGAAA